MPRSFVIKTQINVLLLPLPDASPRYYRQSHPISPRRSQRGVKARQSLARGSRQRKWHDSSRLLFEFPGALQLQLAFPAPPPSLPHGGSTALRLRRPPASASLPALPPPASLWERRRRGPAATSLYSPPGRLCFASSHVNSWLMKPRVASVNMLIARRLDGVRSLVGVLGQVSPTAASSGGGGGGTHN